MPLLDLIKKPKQVNPIFDNNSPFSPYNGTKNDSFVRVPLSPPVNRSTRYNRHRHHMTDLEKHDTNQFFYRQREKSMSVSDKGEVCWRMLCCCCLPCFPLWGRTLCCLVFLVIALFLSFLVLMLSTFKAPQIRLLESNYNLQNGMFSANYSLQNNNFFGFDFENIKVMAYYSGVVETVGSGQISGLELDAQSLVNITVPMQIIIHDQNALNKTSGVFFDSCSNLEGKDVYQRTMDVSFDMMPTFKVFDYPIATVVFHGQKTQISCNEIMKNRQTASGITS